jgi:putative Flp pilus-assembly TadE/G-like protein
MTPRNDNTRDERGVAMMYVAVFLLSSLWLTSLAIDMGKLMATKTELQKAADSAALAGASAIDPLTGTIVQATARQRAYDAAASNNALRERSEAVIIDKDADVEFIGAYKVKVTVHRESSTGNPMTTIFARSLGISSLDIHANATAESKPLISICEGLAPFAPVQVPNGYSTNCDSLYQLKVGSGSSQQGNFMLLSYPDCNEGPCAGIGGGANAVKCYTEHGYSCCAKIGDKLFTEPGNKVGPVRTSLNARWDADTDQRNVCYNQYRGNRSRVFTVPIIDSFDVTGKKQVTVKGFAAFFLRVKPGNGGGNNFALGQFIDYVAPGETGPNPPPDAKVWGIRLVE